jgi:pimeloyl-ACP methyl ester carboxylesterase
MYLLAVALFICNKQAGAQDLVSSSFVRSYSASEIGTSFPVGGLAKYNVEVYKLLYTTKGVNGQKDTVSGLVVYPVLAHTSWPILVYQHGTASSRDGVPSRMSAEAAIGSIGGSLGYVSILPDYLGLGDSDGFHPYVHAKTEASVAVDMLYAVEQFTAKQQVYLNGQIFVTGYSQGGHASMALHRALETEFSDKFKIVAAAHMSGPYSISGDTRLRLLSNDEYFFPGYALYTMLSYNMAYNLYPSLKHFIREPYLQIAEDFFSGKEERLDSVHVKLARILMQEKGKVIPRYMFQDSVLAAIANQPQHPANVAMRDNDVYLWAPKAPTRLFYCKADDQVVYTNSLLADSTMKAKGAVNVGAVDVGSSYNHGQCFQPALLSSVFFFSFFQNVQTDLLEQLPELPVRMFPNPAADWCMLDNVPVGSMITVTDLSGRELRSMQAQESTTEIPLEGIQSGLYMVRVRARTGTWTGKLMVR